MAQKITVKQDEVNPEPIEIIAQSIIGIAKAMKRVEESRLTRRAIVALIHDHSGIPKRDITLVIDNLALLELVWLKKVDK